MRSILHLAVCAPLLAAGCGGSNGHVHWPKSAGAITPDDPADDGGESLDPHSVSDQAAAIEQGGEDITDILDMVEPAAASPSPAASGPAASPPPDAPADAPPAFDETIIVE